MADDQTINLTLTVNKAEAETNLQDYIQQILQAKQYQSQLNTMLQNGSINQSDYMRASNETKISLQGLTGEVNNNIKIIQNQDGSIKQLTASLSANRNLYSSLSQSERENSEVGGKLLTTIQAQNSKVLELNSSIGKNQSNVGNYQSVWGGLGETFGKVGAVFGVVGAAIAGVSGAIAFGKSVIESNIGLEKGWEETTAGVGNAWGYLKNAISNFNFKDLIKNLGDAYQAGVKFAQAMDEISEAQRGLDIRHAEAQKTIAQLEEDSQNKLLTSAQRLDAINQLEKIRHGLSDEQLALDKKSLDTELEKLTTTTKLSKEQILSYIRQGEGEDELTKKAKLYLEAQRQIATTVSAAAGGFQPLLDIWDKLTGKQKTSTQIYEESQKLIKSADQQTIATAKVISNLYENNGDAVKHVTELIEKQANTEANKIEENLGINRKKNMIIEQDQKKQEEDLKKFQELQEKYAQDYLSIQQRISSESIKINEGTVTQNLDAWLAAEDEKINKTKYSEQQKNNLKLLLEKEYMVKLAAETKAGEDFVNSIIGSHAQTQLEKLTEMYEKELITDEQYNKAKAKLNENYQIEEAKKEQAFEKELEKLQKGAENTRSKDKRQQQLKDLELQQSAEKQAILSMQITEEQKQKLLIALDKETAVKRNEINEAANLIEIKGAEEVISQIGEIAGKKTIIAKLAGIAKATISTYEGAASAIADYPTPLNFIMAAGDIAFGLKQIQQIMSVQPPKYASGGYVGGNSHANGGTLIEAEAGEYIINKSAMQNSNIAAEAQKLNSGNANNSISEERIAQIASKVVGAIPVNIVESHMTLYQRQVAVRESKFRASAN